MRDLSACILSYNRGDFLCEAIDSILSQTVKPAEILVFDNGSDSHVWEMVLPYLDQGIVWTGSDVNRSAAWNFSRAIHAAKSEFVLVLHDDDRLCPDFIERQMEFLMSNPQVGAVTCNGFLIDEDGRRNGRVLRPEFVGGGAELYKNGVDVATIYARDSCLPFSPAVYRTKFVRQVEFREEFGKVIDAVFFCDLADSGIIAYQPAPLYECRTHSRQDSSHFPDEELARLTEFFSTRTGEPLGKVACLRELLIRQYTSRQLRRIWFAMHKPFSLGRLYTEIYKLRNNMFSLSAAIRICWRAIAKRM